MNIVTIARLELKRMSRNHMVWFVGVISIVMLLLMDMFHYFTAEEQLKMIQDFSLGMINLMLLFFVIYYPASLLKDELAHKTIYNLLSKPVTRAEVLFGKALAVALLCLFALICNAFALGIILKIKGGIFTGQLVMALTLIYLKHVLLIGFSILFAITPLSTILCSILTLMVYCLGTTKSYFAEYGSRGVEHAGHMHNTILADPYTRGFLEYLDSYRDLFHKGLNLFKEGDMNIVSQSAHFILFSFIPNLRLFDLVEKITLGNAVPPSHLFHCLLHTLGVSIILYALAVYFFNRKEL